MQVFRLVVIAIGLGSALLAQEPAFLGEQFQVNTHTTASQRYPAVSAASEGTFIVVWDSYGSSGTDASSYSIQGQRIFADGSPSGAEFQVNTYFTQIQARPDVTLLADGDFLAVWHSFGSAHSDTSGHSIQAQRFASNGTPIGPEFQINTYTTSDQVYPAVAASPSGDFVVVWSSNGSSGTDTYWTSVQGQRFDAAGDSIGDQFQVNTHTPHSQNLPAVGVASDGSFLVAWDSGTPGFEAGPDGSHVGVMARRFAPDGTPLAAEFQVNSYTTSNQWYVDVATSSEDNFIVVWRSNGSSGTDDSLNSIQGQILALDGMPIGAEFQVNTTTIGYQGYAAVAAVEDKFVVSWHSERSAGSDDADFSIQAQLFSADGTPEGAEVQVNTYTSGNQFAPTVATRPDGSLVIAWQSEGSIGTDTDQFSIQGQAFAVPVYASDFESGDFGDWIVFPPPGP